MAVTPIKNSTGVSQISSADSDKIVTHDDSSSELKKFVVRIDDYPVYVKYSTNKDDYDNLKEHFVIENDEMVYSRPLFWQVTTEKL